MYNSCSSVARGWDIKSTQNTTFLVLLKPIFAPKMKIAPPLGLAMRSFEGLAVIWSRKLEFFWTSPKVAPKIRLDFGEDLFLEIT